MSYHDELHDYITERRWFSGKGREFVVTRVVTTPWLTRPGTTPATRIELVHVRYEDGVTDTYQLPLAYSPEAITDHEHALIGTATVDGHEMYVYDAVFDHAGARALLNGFHQHFDDEVVFRTGQAAELPPPDTTGSPLTGEQSNTSVAYADEAILKVFRRVSGGGNPDIEIHDALTRAGNEHVAPLLGWIDATWESDDGHSVQGQLGMLQAFLTTATDGWTMALSSVRDLLVEEDLGAAEVGGDLSGESERLGEAVASVHASLAELFPTDTFGAEQLHELASAMHTRLDEARRQVPELEEYADALHALLSRLEQTSDSVPVQRVHGDLHLGQTLRTVKGWKLIDFEGEPMKTLDERRALDSPIRDVAGMLRSLHYASGASLQRFGHESHYEYHAEQWYDRNRSAFLRGYTSVAGVDPTASADLLAAYEADKAIYEAVYESRNRPTWLQIPLRALAAIAASSKDSDD